MILQNQRIQKVLLKMESTPSEVLRNLIQWSWLNDKSIGQKIAKNEPTVCSTVEGNTTNFCKLTSERRELLQAPQMLRQLLQQTSHKEDSL